MVFIESLTFTASILDYLRDEDYREFQKSLVLNPFAGSVMPGCGGLRKCVLEIPGGEKARGVD